MSLNGCCGSGKIRAAHRRAGPLGLGVRRHSTEGDHEGRFLAIASLALIAIGLATLSSIDRRNARAEPNGKASVGRFQIAAYTSSTSAIKGCFVIDTTTGELWQKEIIAGGDGLGNADGAGLRKWTKVADGVTVFR